ncbi:MAG: hypothetical protein CVV02_16285 [Firmicutes bacterium HGW-Firmicutes-7]|nr:MAG: hypothetical protein CVV02_16285 [Firmicutes bacterium HGW-Firmicutes-7]
MRNRRIVIISSIVLWVVFILLGSMKVFPVMNDDKVGKTRLLDEIKILNDQSRQYIIEEIVELKEGDFISYHNSAYVGALSASTYWFKVVIDSTVGDEILEIGKPHLSKINMYQINGNGQIINMTHQGRSYPIEQRSIIYPNFTFELLPSLEATTIYFEVTTDTYLQFPITMWKSYHLVNHLIQTNILGGLFYGMMLVMLLYNLTLGISLKDKSYIFYVFFVANYIGLQAVWDGLAYIFLWPGAHTWDLMANPLFILGSTLGLLLFTNSFLQMNQFKKTLKILYYICLAAISLGVFSIIVMSIQTAIYIAMIAVLFTGVYVIYGLISRKLKEDADIIYIVAWEVLIAGNILTLLAGFGILPYNIFTMLAPKIGSITLMVLFSLALASHIKQTEYLRGVADEKSHLLKELQNINKKIIGTMDLNSIVTPLIQSYTSMTGYQKGFVVLNNQENQYEVRIYHPHISDSSLLIEKNCFEHFNGILNGNQVVYIDSKILQYLNLEQWVNHVLIVPLTNYEVSIGAIVLTSNNLIKLNQEVEEMILDYASQVAVNIGNIKLLDEATRSARTDALTGLHNRRYLSELVGAYYHGHRLMLSLTVMMMDIDHFKNINDLYGHQVGDQILKEMAKRWLLVLEDVGEIGRYGGEEFIVFTAGRSFEQSMEIADKLCEVINGEAFIIQSDEVLTLQVTVSIGVAFRTNEKESFEVLFDRADQALYKAKFSGRNQVVEYASLA